MLALLPWLLLALLLLEQLIILPSLLKRAGMASWKGAVPGLHLLAFLQLIGRPWYWIFPLLVPGVNVLMLAIMQVELGIVFGRRSSAEQWVMGALPWYGMVDLMRKDEAYVGPRNWSRTRKSAGREWSESILWAVVVATIVRTFVFEAFKIPTGSMEGSMLVGDYLYVSKTAYGPKVPMTPMTVPFMHNVLPGSMTPSYTSWFSLPYFRLPGLRDVERYDAVVFNFPHGDTIVVHPDLAGHDYYALLRQQAIQAADRSVDKYLTDPAKYDEIGRKQLTREHGLQARPLDKMEHYVKRCVGLPGETVSVVDAQLHIDGAPVENPAGLQLDYEVTFVNGLAAKRAFEELELTNIDLAGQPRADGEHVVAPLALTEGEVQQLRNSALVVEVERMAHAEYRGRLAMFPNVSSPEFDSWDPDNFGPITIPQKGMTVTLNRRNREVYRRVISVYEGHDLVEQGDLVTIDGEPASTYTFEHDYYWMMGDNRHHSADSRMWGFVPETHIVGRASFIWFSKMNQAQHGRSGVRTERIFSKVK